MTEFRFPPLKLPEPAEVETGMASAREDVKSEFRFPRVERVESAGIEARPLAAPEPAAEFSFPPLRLPEPIGGDRTLAPARTGSACCVNCDQGLPCGASVDGSVGAHANSNRFRKPGVAARSHCEHVQPKPTGPAPLASRPRPALPPRPRPLGSALPPGGEDKPPFWEPMDVEAKPRPMFGCKIGEYEWGQGKACEVDWDPSEPPKPQPPPPPPYPPSHEGYCRPVPPEVVALDVDCDRYRCSLESCNLATALCWPITPGQYSPKSRTLPLFSYSEWKDGKLVNADCSLIRAIAHHINYCDAGDEILIAISAWWSDGWPIVKAVESASARGVTVRIITGTSDQGPWFHTTTWIINRLKASIGSENYKLWSSSKSKSFPNISHNKFVLIRRGSSQHLVLISGANWAMFDIARHCDLLTVNSQPIWFAFREFWKSLWSAQTDGEATSYQNEVEDSGAGLTAHFWPVLNAFGEPEHDGNIDKKNPFIQIINKYKAEGTTKIRLIAANWGTGSPGGGLLSVLEAYRAAGADVRVIGNHHLDPACHGSHPCQVQPGVGNKVGSCETDNEVWHRLHTAQISWAKCPPHAKVLLISGVRVEDSTWHQAVYTGSMNFSYEWGVYGVPEWHKSAAMADAFIGVHDDPLIFAQYEEWWKWLCSNTALHRGGPAPVCGDGQPLAPSPKELKASPKPTHG